MAMCALGPKKLAKIAAMLGEPVTQALVRGGWEHYWASVQFPDGRNIMFNYRTGERAPSRFAGLPLSGGRVMGDDGLPK